MRQISTCSGLPTRFSQSCTNRCMCSRPLPDPIPNPIPNFPSPITFEPSTFKAAAPEQSEQSCVASSKGAGILQESHHVPRSGGRSGSCDQEQDASTSEGIYQVPYFSDMQDLGKTQKGSCGHLRFKEIPTHCGISS